MELKELILLAFGLVLSGLIAYKTFQWALYEEIGVGLASLFLGFAIVVFLAFTNYEIFRNWTFFKQTEVSTLPEKINEATEKSIKLFSGQLEKQKELIEPVTQSLQQVAVARNHSADEAHKLSKEAMETAKKAKEQSERLGAIQAWAMWDSIMAEFFEVDRYLLRWEEKKGFKRDGPAAKSVTELERRLGALRETLHLPASIKTLYLKRQKKYEILKKLKQAVEPYAHQYVKMDLSLPAPPRLPSHKP